MVLRAHMIRYIEQEKMAWDDILYSDSGRLNVYFLAVLLVVAVLAVWAWIYALYAMFKKDTLIVFKAKTQENMTRDQIGRQIIVANSGQGSTGIDETIEGSLTETYEDGSARPYNNRARFNQELGQGAFNELPSLINFNNASAIAIGGSTARVPVLNSCSQVLTPADMARAQMEAAYENKHNKPYYIDGNYNAATPMENFNGGGRSGMLGDQGTYTVSGLNLALQGK